MTRPERDYDDILSRVLHSTLDPIEPAGDGLAKIQRRIAEPWLKRRVLLLRTEFGALGWLILVRCEPFLSGARSRLASLTAGSGRRSRYGTPARSGTAARASAGHAGAAGRGRLGGAAQPGWLGPTMAWMRPALAVAAAVVIVVVGVFAAGQISATFSPAANSSNAGSGHGGHGVPAASRSARFAMGAQGPGGHSQGAGQGRTGKNAAWGKASPRASCSPTP